MNILPFAGGTVRYVRLVPQVAELEGLRNVECAVAFGANSSGDRAIRLVRQVGKVKVTELWFINPQMVSVFESPACDEGLRKLVWGPTTYVSPLTPLPDSPAATSTTAPSTDPAPTSTTVAG